MTAPDCWAQWLATRRFGGDAEVKREFVAELARRRDDVLDKAEIDESDILLDVGCGEGLVGFGALQHGAAHVVFSDISPDLLDFCREAAGALGVVERCRFVLASADDLSPITSESVDIVATRSVLIYVADKQAAFDEFFRVLRPGGRISLYEPINRFGHPGQRSHFGGYDLTPVPGIASKLRALYEKLQPPGDDPMLDFDERDLIRACEGSGFFPVNLQLHAEIAPLKPRRWEAFLNMAGNPKIPTLAEAMERALDPEERQRLTAHLRPLVETGKGTWRMAHAFLWAAKPSGEVRR